MKPVIIASGARTPIGNFGGCLRHATAIELGGIAIRRAGEIAAIAADQVQEVWVGHARQAGNGPNPGKLAAVAGGIPYHVPVTTVQMACLSSLQATILGFKSIAFEDAECVMVAGMEHMSSIPYLNLSLRWGNKSGDVTLVDGLTRDGFFDPMTNQLMGELAEAYATRWDISRAVQDDFAVQSHHRAHQAATSGVLDPIIAPVPGRGAQNPVITRDEHVRPETTSETLGRLRPAFSSTGTVTAGNASAVTDGAAALVLMSEAMAERHQVNPQVRIVSYAVASTHPRDYGIAPVPATQEALRRAGLRTADIDVWEINEAFAVQTLAVTQLLDIDWHKINPFGGAIALGHPVGMSGPRIVLHAAHALITQGGRYAVATLCGNGGQGATVVLERTAP